MDANGTPLPKPTLPSRGAALASVGIKAIGAYDTESGLRPARSHADLDRVHDFLNRELFDGKSPALLDHAGASRTSVRTLLRAIASSTSTILPRSPTGSA